MTTVPLLLTPPPADASPARWIARCDACQYALGDEAYRAAEDAAGPSADPACPRCSRSLWSFHNEDLS